MIGLPGFLDATVKAAGLATALFTSTEIGLPIGVQVSVGGQTMPSPYYIDDDVQYFPPGPEFKLSREAAAQKAFNAKQRLKKLNAERRPRGSGGGSDLP